HHYSSTAPTAALGAGETKALSSSAAWPPQSSSSSPEPALAAQARYPGEPEEVDFQTALNRASAAGLSLSIRRAFGKRAASRKFRASSMKREAQRRHSVRRGVAPWQDRSGSPRDPDFRGRAPSP